MPLPSTCYCPTVCCSRATFSTLQAVRSSPLLDKVISDSTGDLAVAGDTTRSNIRAPRHAFHQATQTEAPFPPPRRASRGSPLGAVRDRRDRRNAQISECARRRGGREGRGWLLAGKSCALRPRWYVADGQTDDRAPVRRNPSRRVLCARRGARVVVRRGFPEKRFFLFWPVLATDGQNQVSSRISQRSR